MIWVFPPPLPMAFSNKAALRNIQQEVAHGQKASMEAENAPWSAARTVPSLMCYSFHCSLIVMPLHWLTCSNSKPASQPNNYTPAVSHHTRADRLQRFLFPFTPIVRVFVLHNFHFTCGSSSEKARACIVLHCRRNCAVPEKVDGHFCIESTLDHENFLN